MVQSRRDKRAAKKFFLKLLKRLRYVPRAIVTNKLKSYSAAKAEVMPSVAHHRQKYQNNRAENSHQPTRLRERLMRRFKSLGHGQRFLSAFGIINSHFRVGRHLYRASAYRKVMRRDNQYLGYSTSAPNDHFAQGLVDRALIAKTAYNQKGSDADFASQWENCLQEAADVLEAEANRRAMAGSDLLLIFLLKGLRPEKYRERVTLPPHELDKLIEQALAERRGNEALSEIN